MKILRRRRRLADLNIVFPRQLQKSLNPRARMLGPLTFISMGQQHHQSRRQIPFIFAGADELIDDHLRAIREITELRFPRDQRFWIIAAIAILETQDTRFR